MRSWMSSFESNLDSFANGFPPLWPLALPHLVAYYLSKERNEDVAGAYRRYQQYLRVREHQFPPGAFALGTAMWWQNASDHRCPHDSGLESITISEQAGGEERATSIRIRLLSAYDGHIELFYPRVFSYQLASPSCTRGLGDWLYDEFTLSTNKHVIHEIEWRGFLDDPEPRWIIEASDIEAQWTPN